VVGLPGLDAPSFVRGVVWPGWVREGNAVVVSPR
jgi:hypothetical protein